MTRTLDNCALIKRYGKPSQYDGKCEGLQVSKIDDEPCKECKKCKLHYLNNEDNP